MVGLRHTWVSRLKHSWYYLLNDIGAGANVPFGLVNRNPLSGRRLMRITFLWSLYLCNFIGGVRFSWYSFGYGGGFGFALIIVNEDSVV